MKGTLGNMMQQVQKIQEEMQKAQAEIAEKEVTGTAGGDTVTVTMNGHHQVKKIHIDYEMIGDDNDMLEDLLVAAFNDALNKVSDMQKQSMGGLTDGFDLPAGFKMPF